MCYCYQTWRIRWISILCDHTRAPPCALPHVSANQSLERARGMGRGIEWHEEVHENKGHTNRMGQPIRGAPPHSLLMLFIVPAPLLVPLISTNQNQERMRNTKRTRRHSAVSRLQTGRLLFPRGGTHEWREGILPILGRTQISRTCLRSLASCWIPPMVRCLKNTFCELAYYDVDFLCNLSFWA